MKPSQQKWKKNSFQLTFLLISLSFSLFSPAWSPAIILGGRKYNNQSNFHKPAPNNSSSAQQPSRRGKLLATSSKERGNFGDNVVTDSVRRGQRGGEFCRGFMWVQLRSDAAICGNVKGPLSAPRTYDDQLIKAVSTNVRILQAIRMIKVRAKRVP